MVFRPVGGFSRLDFLQLCDIIHVSGRSTVGSAYGLGP